jgi:glycosyltransferase involved in cell wall biosynthesis
MIELSILMPCLNESETLELCIKKAQTFISKNNIKGEILIADNGSDDGSQDIAFKNGARVVNVKKRGYGEALTEGIAAAKGKFVIMGDSDDSYDFSNLMPYLKKLRDGYDLVMGNRFKGGIAKGAMPPLHKYLGNPVLSLIGRVFFYNGCRDFHCGLRGFNRKSIMNLNLQSGGMEFASEMIIRAAICKLQITEVPTTLSRDGRSRPPHLRSWRDGWRHLRLLLIWSPRWLFFYPGLLLIITGLISSIALLTGSIYIKELTLDVHTLLFSSSLVIIGYQSVFFSIHSTLYGNIHNLLSNKSSFNKFIEFLSLERGLTLGVSFLLVGLTLALFAVKYWSHKQFGVLNPSLSMRIVIPSIFFLLMGSSTIFNIFFLHLLQILNNKKLD